MSRWFRMTGQSAQPTDEAIPDFVPLEESTNTNNYLRVTTSPGNDNESDHEDDDHFVDEDLFDDVWEGRPVRHLFWEDKNHWQVISGIYGSVWPRVLPYCIFNLLWSLVVYYLKETGIDITVKPSAHKYLSALMSFVLVTRLKITFDDYMANSKHLSGLNRACQDLVANLCLLTSNDKSRRAKQWRQDVTYSVLLMLRVAIGVLDFRTTNENPWLLDELANENEEEVLKYSFKVPEPEQKHHHRKTSPIAKTERLAKQSIDKYDATVADMKECQRDGTTTRLDGDEELLDMPNLKQRLAHVEDSERNVLEESSRAVFCLALNVRREILKQRDGTWFQSRDDVWQHPCNEETRLLDFVSVFLTNFSGLYRRITTPMPFPLVQMNKILLFLWLFTMPMCLSGKKMNQFVDQPVMICIVVFMISFGFLGIEFVSVELADSFGNHPSDFDDLGQAQLTMEDCYISIYRQDGRNWAKALRKRVKPRSIDDNVPALSETQQESNSNGLHFPDENSRKAHIS